MKLDIGRVISRTFSLYFKLFGVLVVGALIVNAVLHYLVLPAVANLPSLLPALLLLVVAALAAPSLIQALAAHAVADMEDGQRSLSMGELFRLAGPAVGVVVLVSILMALGAVVGLILLIVPGVMALTWWSVAVPAAVIDRPGVFGAFSRSIALVRGNAWRVFWLGVVMVIITFVGGTLVSFVVDVVDLDALVGAVGANVVSSSIITPLTAVGYAVLYFELRRLRDRPAQSSDAATTDPSPL